jgi:ribosomal protein S8
MSLKIANKNNKNFIYVRPTKEILSFILLLLNSGFISGFSLIKHKKINSYVLKIYLKYKNSRKRYIKKIVLLSSLSKYVFITIKKLHLINGNVFFIITPFGQMNINCAKLFNIGGKLSFYLS